VLERGGVVVGAVLWEVEDGALYISRVSVDPESRRQGIARALVDEAEREARAGAFSRMTLGVRLELVGTASSSDRAASWTPSFAATRASASPRGS
jgi:GNAT superfamily N-acetyltransferase